MPCGCRYSPTGMMLQASFFLIGFKEEDFASWQDARGLLTQEYIMRMKSLAPEQVRTPCPQPRQATRQRPASSGSQKHQCHHTV